MASSLFDSAFAFIGRSFFEISAKKHDYETHLTALRISGDTIVTQFRTARDNPHNRALLRHIIGIEQWAQVRLRELLGAAPFHEEYDKYQPNAHITVSELAEIMHQTRNQSCTLVQELADAHVDLHQRVTHNQLGLLSASGWLVYIRLHAAIESKKYQK